MTKAPRLYTMPSGIVEHRTHAANWWLGATAVRIPALPALTIGNERMSFAELAEAAENMARALAGLGLCPGDRVGLCASPSRFAVTAIHAAQRIGVVVAPYACNLTEAELSAQIAVTAPRIVLADDKCLDAVGVAAVSREIRVLGEDSLATGYNGGRLETPAQVAPSAAHSLICTSGTTGFAKAVLLSNHNHHASAIAAAARLGYGEGQRWLGVLPLHHVGGLSTVLRASIVGAEILLHDGFDAVAVREALIGEDVAHVSVVPTMLYRLLAATGDEKARALRGCCFLVGGAALSRDLFNLADATGCDVRATYGLTEAASQVATSERGELRENHGTSGRPLDGIDVRIDSADAEGFGDILVKGPQVFREYLGDAPATLSVMRDGWLRTGDTGRLDTAGRLYVSSRRVDLIVSGGENVRPEEVERTLETHPAIAEAGVYGLPDPQWGQRVAAVVVPRDGACIDEEEILAWCRESLARHKLPRVIHVARSLPKTAGGKLMRKELGKG